MDHREENSEAVDAINMEHVADSALDSIQPGKIVRGEIVTIDSEYAYVNVGIKSDGGISLEEFDEKPQVGDVIDVMLQSRRLVDGVYQFSKIAADTEKRWQSFLETYKEDAHAIKGKISSATKKGKIVECENLTAFLPYSLAADLKKISSSEEEYEFIINSINPKKKSVILSRKDFLDSRNKEVWDNFLANYKAGDRIKGEPVKFVEFGAFIRIEGIDALLHRNDMSWKNVFKQRKILKLGEEREFLILDINEADHKISLGLKQLKEDPWLNIDERYKVGDRISGKVITIINTGAFIEVDEDIDGFVRSSDISWTKNNPNAFDYFKKGEMAELTILEVNKEEKRILLGMKQLLENPWDTIEEKFPVGSVHKKKVKKIVKFGMFVELENDIDGLVHVSDLSWSDEKKDAADLYKVNDEVEVKILDINKSEMRISCGIKQLTKSPWEVISEKYRPGTIVDGVISGITQFGIFLKLEENVEGLVHVSEVSTSRIENLEDHFKEGESLQATVLGVDVEKKRLSLSIKQFEIKSEKEELKKILDNTGSRKATLGDFVDIKLEDKE